MYRRWVRPLLFACDPERIHHLTIAVASFFLRCPLFRAICNQRYTSAKVAIRRSFCGLTFNGLVGFAAGFDKNARLCDRLAHLGYSFVEVGTVTPRPQSGNPKPRVFRLPADKAIINRMGFNSDGVELVAARLAKHRKHRVPIAGNIGKNSDTPNQNASRDYQKGMEALYPYVDFFVVNVSCPNVKDLCALQAEDTLLPIIESLTHYRASQATYKPILLKLGSDAAPESLTYTVQLALKEGIDGFVLSNTTPRRENLQTTQERLTSIGVGGLSGRPLHMQALHALRLVREVAGCGIPIIGVGGIFSGADALAMLQAGASFVELYTGVIYQGPSLARRINRYLKEREEEIPLW